jgi:Domain of Unknown Function (DUF1080)
MIVAQGNHIQHFLNGQLVADLRDENEPGRRLSGELSLSVWLGLDPPLVAEYKDIELKQTASDADFAGISQAQSINFPAENPSAMPNADWITLFDGTTVYGWVAANSTEFPDDAWSLQDGCLQNVPGGPKTTLYTREKFRDFELEFEWRIGYGGNSGVFYSPEGVALNREFQLIDDDRSDFPNGGRWTLHEDDTGALWGVIAPSGNKELSPYNEWNHGKLLVKGTHVEHWINDHRVVEYELGSPELGRKIDNTRIPYAKTQLKGQGKTQFMQLGDVPIGLSIQGGEVSFRNIRIRRLDKE